MLNNLRNKFDPLLEKVSIGFASLGFGPNFWTWMGLILSIISAIMFSLHSPSIGVNWYTATVLGGIFLLIAGFFDAIDGSVARVTKKTSAIGGFLDSIIDKVSEIIIFIGILIGNFTDPVLVLVTLSLAILVSYTRARAEAIGVDLKGKGIAERAERILILSILAFIPFRDNISVALWIISILATITILERLKIVSEIFGLPLFSSQTFRQIFQREDMTNRDYTLGSNLSDSSSNINNRPPPPPPSAAKSSMNAKEVESRPESEIDIKTEESKSKTLPKADYLDKTDPNETGRNVAQLIFEQENEDKKATTKPMTTSTSTNSKNGNNNSSSNSSNTSEASSTTSTSTNSKKEDNKTTNDNQVQDNK